MGMLQSKTSFTLYSSKKEIDKILDFEFKLDTMAMFDYKRGIETGKLERMLYKPFVTVAHDVVASYLAEKYPGETCTLRLYETHEDARLCNSYTRRSLAVGPDVVSLWTSSNVSIDFVQSPFLFKAENVAKLGLCQRKCQILSSMVRSRSLIFLRQGTPTRSHLPVDSPKGKSDQKPVPMNPLYRDKTKPKPLQEMSIIPETSQIMADRNCTKRKRSIADVGGRDIFTEDEAQLASYAVKCFESTGRHFVAGVYVHHWTIILWYYDRLGATRTVSFQFSVDDDQMLGLVLVALNQVDATQSGYSPFLYAMDA
ncbi:hypothetical protein C8R42DRAFT_664174 [Lentinula raphanica]|nr:hypothetical protein C8R42DRAFT_664174 [Lentinula raphanica]